MTDNPTDSSTETSPLIAAAHAFASLTEPGARNTEIAQLGDRAGLVLVHSPDDFDPHFARSASGTTVCAQQVYRVLNTEQAARVSVLCTACETAAQHISTDVGASPRKSTARGCAPRHCGNPDVGAALGVLNGMAPAVLTEEHDITEPSDIDLPVRGFAIEPRGHGLVAAYWLERGSARRRDDGWHGPALDALADRFKDAGWAVEPLRASSLCVFAHRPQPAV